MRNYLLLFLIIQAVLCQNEELDATTPQTVADAAAESVPSADVNPDSIPSVSESTVDSLSVTSPESLLATLSGDFLAVQGSTSDITHESSSPLSDLRSTPSSIDVPTTIAVPSSNVTIRTNKGSIIYVYNGTFKASNETVLAASQPQSAWSSTAISFTAIIGTLAFITVVAAVLRFVRKRNA